VNPVPVVPAIARGLHRCAGAFERTGCGVLGEAERISHLSRAVSEHVAQ
jgi:hypothetical protein